MCVCVCVCVGGCFAYLFSLIVVFTQKEKLKHVSCRFVVKLSSRVGPIRIIHTLSRYVYVNLCYEISMYVKCGIAFKEEFVLILLLLLKNSKRLQPFTKLRNAICKSVITFHIHTNNVLHNFKMRGICCVWAYFSSIHVHNIYVACFKCIPLNFEVGIF